jgi:hypothetical protein
MVKAKRPSNVYPSVVRVKVLEHYWDEEAGTYMARVQWPDEEKPPRQPTLKEQMIVAIVRRRYPRDIPADVSIADLHRLVANPETWKAECQRRKINPPHPPPPNRDTVARALRRASLIE